MALAIPSRKPQMTKAEILERITLEHPDFKIPEFLIVGIRGYYKKTMGHPDQNDRRLYDDAIFLVSKDEFYSFNANCDPGAFRKGIANLKPGIWTVYRFDLHKGQYMALCQRSGIVTVIRDDKGEDSGYFGINIHRGGINSVSSEGCQTIPPSQYDGDKGWLARAKAMAAKVHGKGYAKLTYTYILFEN